MKQYCRYCTFLTTGNGIYCMELDKEIRESTAKHTNTCKYFDFNPIDAFGENGKEYRPRQEKKKKCKGQLKLEFIESEG